MESEFETLPPFPLTFISDHITHASANRSYMANSLSLTQDYPVRCASTSVFPLLWKRARGTPQFPHLCSTFLNQFVMYGMQPKQRQTQHKSAAACVRPPFMNSQVVICRLLHAGQSTTAGVSCNEARGVAVGQLFLFSVMVLFSVTMSWFSGMMFLLSVIGSMESWVVCLVKVEVFEVVSLGYRFPLAHESMFYTRELS